MFPVDSEFIAVYTLYSLMLFVIIYGMTSSKYKSFYKWNLLMFIIYIVVAVFVFLDPENFEGGDSLVVLFYSLLLVLIHFMAIICFYIYLPICRGLKVKI